MDTSANKLKIPAAEQPLDAGIKRSRSTVMLENTILERTDNFEQTDWETCKDIYKRHQEHCTSMSTEDCESYTRLLRFHGGWWGSDEKTAFSGPKKRAMNVGKLKQTLVLKTMEWMGVHDALLVYSQKIEGEGIFVFQHNKIKCFRYVGKGCNILNACQRLIYGALGGTLEFETFLTMLLSTLETEWKFHFESIADNGDIDNALNEAIFKYSTLWPFGANCQIILTHTTLPNLRRYAKKWGWPAFGNMKTSSDCINNDHIKGIGVDRIVDLQDLNYSEFRHLIIETDSKGLELYASGVKTLHTHVTRIKTRCNMFGDDDWGYLQDIVNLQSEMFNSDDKNRIRSLKIDMRLQSGWWGLNSMRGVHEFDGIKLMNLACLTDVLVNKCLLWNPETTEADLKANIGQPGTFCFQHKTIPHFRLVGKSENVLNHVRRCINDSLTACSDFPQMAALLLCTKADEWYFYYIPCEGTKYLDIDFNDMVMKHDSLWPNGLNRELQMNPLTLGDMQLSCIRYKWPQERNGSKVLPLPPAML